MEKYHIVYKKNKNDFFVEGKNYSGNLETCIEQFRQENPEAIVMGLRLIEFSKKSHSSRSVGGMNCITKM